MLEARGFWVVLSVVVATLQSAGQCSAGDWPQWRYDARRSACSPDRLPDELHLLWKREYPPLEPAFWQARQERVQFDLGYEPVVAGKTLLVGSSRNDRMTALDTETGEERWRYYADGPIRFAPAVANDKVYFVSDDGCLHCLALQTGQLVWKHRGAPSLRKCVGNGRLISVWPARGGPVVYDGRVYFAAGVWPFEGIFVYALDAETGDVVWINDRSGSLYLNHPHAAASFGGPSPQGYLLIHNDRLVVPSSRAFPAFFDLDSGELSLFDFGHGGHGSCPGSWFVVSDSNGDLVVDSDINTEAHDVGQQVIGQSGIRREAGESLQPQIKVGGMSYQVNAGVAQTVKFGETQFRFQDGVDGADGQIHTALTADNKLFVVTRSGTLFCFGPEHKQPQTHRLIRSPLDSPRDVWRTKAKKILAVADCEEGYALVLGLETGRLVEELLLQSKLHIVAIDADANKVETLRQRLDEAGLYGDRVAIHQGNPVEFGLPPFLARLIVSEDLDAAGPDLNERFFEQAFRSLRPYGGTLCLEVSDAQNEQLAEWSRRADLPQCQIKRDGDFALVIRAGALPGSADFTGEQNDDQVVRSPLGLLWFGDTFHHHKLFHKTYYHDTGRGLPAIIQVVDGVMKHEITAEPYGPNPKGVSYHAYMRYLEEHKKYGNAFIDVYTGQPVSRRKTERIAFRQQPLPHDPGTNVWRMPPSRRNPLTGIQEGREFLKTYGCDQFPVDYGMLWTMRSGTPSYYDKRLESGTINIGGVRSGCRNTIIPACGVLSLPSWTGNCTCNYPVHTSLALTTMPQEYEQWSAWGDVAKTGPIECLGINFGAPGDRSTDDGTLWLDFPSVGGPSPDVAVTVVPEQPRWYYRHALWMTGGSGWPWVTASGVEGIRTIRIEPIAKQPRRPGGTIGIHWAGTIEPEHTETYTFYAESNEGVRLWIGGKLVLDNSQNLRRGERGEVSGTVALESGIKADIKMEYYGPLNIQKGQRRHVALRWSSPSSPKAVVPASRLFATDGQRGGLTAAYYDTKFSGPSVLAVDPQIDFDWGRALPPPLQPLDPPAKPIERYTVELYFGEPNDIQPGQRVFSVTLQDKQVLTDFDIVREAAGPNRGVVRKFENIPVSDTVALSFVPKVGEPLICGVRIVACHGEN